METTISQFPWLNLTCQFLYRCTITCEVKQWGKDEKTPRKLVYGSRHYTAKHNSWLSIKVWMFPNTRGKKAGRRYSRIIGWTFAPFSPRTTIDRSVKPEPMIDWGEGSDGFIYNYRKLYLSNSSGLPRDFSSLVRKNQHLEPSLNPRWCWYVLQSRTDNRQVGELRAQARRIMRNGGWQ